MIVKLLGTELRHEIERLGIDVMAIGISYGDNPYLKGNGSWQYQYMYYLGLIIWWRHCKFRKTSLASAAWACLRTQICGIRLKWNSTFAGSNTASRQRKNSWQPRHRWISRGIAAKEQTDAAVWQGLIDLGIAAYSSLKREASVSAC